MYSSKIKIEAKRLFVQEGKTPVEISVIFNGKPSHQAIANWANKRDTKTLRNWYDDREQYEKEQYEKLAPKNIAAKILQKIEKFLDKEDEEFTTKDADALAKLQKNLKDITSTEYQIPIMYQVLSDFLLFLNNRHKDLLSTELTNAVRQFRTHLRKTIES